MPLTRRDFLKLGCATAITSVAFPGLLPAAVAEVPVLMYHDIAELFRDDYTVAPSLFASQMEWLHVSGYRAVLLRDLAESGTRPDKAVILTFDDGYASFVDYVLPLLQQYRFKAHLNIIGKPVGSFMDFGGNRPLLSWDEYRYLQASDLVAFGCHSFNLHSRGGVLTVAGDRLEQDLALFQETLLRETGSTTDILAWPYGIYNEKSVRIARNLGFRYLLTSIEGRLRVTGPFDEIPRLKISNRFDLVSFQQYIGDKP